MEVFKFIPYLCYQILKFLLKLNKHITLRTLKNYLKKSLKDFLFKTKKYEKNLNSNNKKTN